jgi:hypothetical protein
LKFPQGNLAEPVLEMAVMDKISLFGKLYKNAKIRIKAENSPK